MRRSVILHRLCHLIRADFIERTRRNSFIIVVAMTVYISYSFVPPAGSDFVSVALERWRGVYNSAWLTELYVAGVRFVLRWPHKYRLIDE